MNYMCWHVLLLLMCTGVTTGFFYGTQFITDLVSTVDKYPGIGDIAQCDFGFTPWTGVILDIIVDTTVSYYVRHFYTDAKYHLVLSKCKCYAWDARCGVALTPPVCDEPNEALISISSNNFVTSINECDLRKRDGLQNEGQRCWDECDTAGKCQKTKCAQRTLLWCDYFTTVDYCGTGVCCRYGSKWDANMGTTGTSFQECAQARIGEQHHHRCVAALADNVIDNKSPCQCKALLDGFYQVNDIAHRCPACSPGYENLGCASSEDGKCQRCGTDKFSIDGTGPCKACLSNDNEEYRKCFQKKGHALVGCGGNNAGTCAPCPVGTFKDTAGATCKTCPAEFVQSCQAASCPKKTTLSVQSGNAMNVNDECHVMEGCGGETAGTCRCNKGYYTTDSVASKLKPCTLCPDGKFKTEVSTGTECVNCGHFRTHSDEPRTSFENCNCRNTQNHIEKYSTGPNNLNNLECVLCSQFEEPVGSKPFKLAGTDECTACPQKMYFDLTDSKHPYQNCTDIPIMRIVCKPGNYWAVEPPRDSYRIIQSFITEVPDNYYLDIATYKVEPCTALCANQYKYAQGCGGVQDHSIWISDDTTNTNLKVNLITDPEHPNMDCDETESKQIQREGNCEPCTPCGLNYYNSACKPGPGTCQRCKTHSDCGTGKFYLRHELDNGCDDAHAVTDYTCVSCKQVIQNDQGFWIMQACGNNVFTRWKDDNTVNDKPNSLACDYSSTDASCDVFDGGTRRTQWNSPGTPLPYCPPGWYVLKTCFEAHPEEWHPDCCERCENNDLFPERKKNPDWEACTGQTSVDTQRTVARCEDNYFEDTDAKRCKLCEMCTAV